MGCMGYLRSAPHGVWGVGVKAGTHLISVPLTATGRGAKKHGRRLTIHAALTVAGKTGTATGTVRA
jgi:hypothetical protein